MGELPEGVNLPPIKTPEVIRSASVILSRECEDGHEILLGHRVPELVSFPDYWAFPGGGICDEDRHSAKVLGGKLGVEGKYELACFALLREMVEEVGLSPDGKGNIIQVTPEVRELVCGDKAEWLRLVQDGSIKIEMFQCQMVTDRTTPPFSPRIFQNYFFHVPMGKSTVSPSFPPGRSEFDDFKWWRPDVLVEKWERNQIRIPPPIVTLIRDLANGISDRGDLLKACDKLSSEPPSGDHRIEFAPGVEAFPLRTETIPPSTHTNCYIIGELGGECVVVDPSSKTPDSLAILKKKIDHVTSMGSVIIATVFTHRHPDHVGNLDMISDVYDAPVWASRETIQSIPPEYPFKILSEGDKIVLEGPSERSSWDVIETPGHCPGHICLVSESGIVSGDNCVVIGTILVPSSEGDMSSYIKGLKRLYEMSPTMLFPGHGPPCTNPRKLLGRYIRHRTSRHEKVLEAVASGIDSLRGIAEYAYLDTPDAHPILSLDQTLSHLKSLVSSGKVELRDGLYLLPN